MAMFDTLMAIRAAPGGEALWLRALYPWAFRPAFFEDPANIEVALGAALNYPHAQGLDAMALQVAALKGYQRETALADLALPVQVIYGEHDLMIPEAPARAAFAAIPGVEQRTIADAGHSLHWDQPQAVLAALTGFLDRL
jgi:pimeloyl-ACP methyl ester carboxylesterase